MVVSFKVQLEILSEEKQFCCRSCGPCQSPSENLPSLGKGTQYIFTVPIKLAICVAGTFDGTREL